MLLSGVSDKYFVNLVRSVVIYRPYQVLLGPCSWAVGPKEVLLVQILGLDILGLCVSLISIQVWCATEGLNVQPTHQVRDGVVIL